MANIRPHESGLSMNVWLDDSGEKRQVQHKSPRLKVQRNKGRVGQFDSALSVSICMDPDFLGRVRDSDIELSRKDLEKLGEWIQLNQVELLRHWVGEISSIEFGSLVKKV